MPRYSDEELEQMENEFVIDDDAEEGPIHRSKPKQNGKAPTPANDIDEIIGEIMQDFLSPGEYWIFPKMYLRIMPPLEALLFSYLVNHNTKCKKKKGEPKTWYYTGWFYLKRKTFHFDFGLSERTQSNWLRKLVDRGLIKIKMMDLPPKRYVQIQWTKFAELVRKNRHQ